jgi:hypothetical protein
MLTALLLAITVTRSLDPACVAECRTQVLVESCIQMDCAVGLIVRDLAAETVAIQYQPALTPPGWRMGYGITADQPGVHWIEPGVVWVEVGYRPWHQAWPVLAVRECGCTDNSSGWVVESVCATANAGGVVPACVP